MLLLPTLSIKYVVCYLEHAYIMGCPFTSCFSGFSSHYNLANGTYESDPSGPGGGQSMSSACRIIKGLSSLRDFGNTIDNEDTEEEFAAKSVDRHIILMTTAIYKIFFNKRLN
jgi:hypothetical protein